MKAASILSAALTVAILAAISPASAAFGPKDVPMFDGPGFGPKDLTTFDGPGFGPADIRSFDGPQQQQDDGHAVGRGEAAVIIDGPQLGMIHTFHDGMSGGQANIMRLAAGDPGLNG